MKQKERWASEWWDSLPEEPIHLLDAWLAGFEFAKIEIIKILEKDYEWEREEIENVGEDEL